jgi:hypothetical protein
VFPRGSSGVFRVSDLAINGGERGWWGWPEAFFLCVFIIEERLLSTDNLEGMFNCFGPFFYTEANHYWQCIAHCKLVGMHSFIGPN